MQERVRMPKSFSGKCKKGVKLRVLTKASQGWWFHSHRTFPMWNAVFTVYFEWLKSQKERERELREAGLYCSSRLRGLMAWGYKGLPLG